MLSNIMLDIPTQLSNIYVHYCYFISVIYKIFSIIERYSRKEKIDLHADIRAVFVNLIRNKISFKFLVNSFIKEINEKQRNYPIETNEERYKLLKDVGQLLKLAYSDQQRELIRILCDDEYINSERYVSRVSMRSFLDTGREFLEHERQMMKDIFNSFVETSTTRTAHSVLMNSINFETSLSEMKTSLNNRNKEVATKLFNIMMFIGPTSETIKTFNKTINEALENESSELMKIVESIEFYKSLATEEFNNDARFAKDIEQYIVDYINKDPINLIKSIIKFLTKAATTDSNAIKIKGVIVRMSNKSELELLHTRNTTKRLLPPDPKKIEKERKLMQQLRGFSSFLEFRTLGKLLCDANASLEYHIGPVLFFHISFWPYKPLFFPPIKLKPITDEITEKYKKIYETRILKFPIQAWLISLKDNKRNVTIVCNGLQAETLLYLNDSPFITTSSLLPDVQETLMSAILETMSSAKFPILKKSEDRTKYEINSAQLKGNLIKLPNFSIVHSDPQAKVAKLEAVDAALARVLKRNKRMKTDELISTTKTEMLEQFSTDITEIKTRIDALVERGYIGIEGDESIYLP